MENEKIKELKDEELEQVVGGTRAETQEFVNAFLGYAQRSGSMSAGTVSEIKGLSLEEQANIVMAGIAKGGGLASLQFDSKRNSYMIDGGPISHKQLVSFLNSL